MAFFYVKDDGTAGATTDDGRSVAARTGTWNVSTGDYYATLEAAFDAGKSNPPTAGDVVCWSDASSDTGGTWSQFIPIGVHIMCVDDANQENYSKATSLLFDSTGMYRPIVGTNGIDASVYAGFKVQMSGSAIYTSTGARAIFREISLTNKSASAAYEFVGTSTTNLFINTEITTGVSGRVEFGGSRAECYGGSITAGATSSSVLTLKVALTIKMCGTDFSDCTAGTALVTWPSNTDSEAAFFHATGCKLYTGWHLTNSGASDAYHGVIEACDSRYQYYEESRRGTVDFLTNISYDAHDTLDDGSTRGSYELETNSDTNSFQPLLLGGLYATRVLSATLTEATTKKKVRIRFVPALGDSLDTGDVAFIVAYPNVSTPYQYEVIEHWIPETQAGASLSTETTSGNWTGSGLATSAYYFDIDMGNPGNGRVMVIPGVCKPNVTVYFSWQLEFVA